MTAIVYTSNTGYTEQYAKMLAEKTNLPIYSLEQASEKLKPTDEIIYFGWLMAGAVVNYKVAAKHFKIKAVCAVGLCETGTIAEKVRKTNSIPESAALFTLQGGYSPKKLKGMHKFIMSLVTKALIKKIEKINSPRESDIEMKNALINGGSFVKEENLAEIEAFLNN